MPFCIAFGFQSGFEELYKPWSSVSSWRVISMFPGSDGLQVPNFGCWYPIFEAASATAPCSFAQAYDSSIRGWTIRAWLSTAYALTLLFVSLPLGSSHTHIYIYIFIYENREPWGLLLLMRPALIVRTTVGPAYALSPKAHFLISRCQMWVEPNPQSKQREFNPP